MIEILGFTAALLTTISFLPQAIKVWKTRSAEDLSLAMFLLFTIGVFLWLIYGLMINNYPVIISNSFTLVFALSILAFKVKEIRSK